MLHGYFNYTSQMAEDRWARGTFLRRWWHIYARDPRWVPPFYPQLRHALQPGRTPHLDRQAPLLIHLEALPGRRRSDQGGWTTSGLAMEEGVAAAVFLVDPRRQDRTAHLALLRCVNDEESLERLLAAAMEPLWARGCRRILGPMALSPHLHQGLLQDHFHLLPPLHTPYNPPYLPELVEGLMEPVSTARLFEVAVSGPAERPEGPARLVPCTAAELATVPLSLWAAATADWGDFPAPDAPEVAFLSQWVGIWPVWGWLAVVGEQPVGFVWLQPDLAAQLRRARGGRPLPWRWWLRWRSRRPVSAGRLLWGGVLPAWRGQGIGTQLWRQALATAWEQGWRTLTVGPLPEPSPGAGFLQKRGASPRQRYALYATEL